MWNILLHLLNALNCHELSGWEAEQVMNEVYVKRVELELGAVGGKGSQTQKHIPIPQWHSGIQGHIKYISLYTSNVNCTPLGCHEKTKNCFSHLNKSTETSVWSNSAHVPYSFSILSSEYDITSAAVPCTKLYRAGHESE